MGGNESIDEEMQGKEMRKKDAPIVVNLFTLKQRYRDIRRCDCVVVNEVKGIQEIYHFPMESEGVYLLDGSQRKFRLLFTSAGTPTERRTRGESLSSFVSFLPERVKRLPFLRLFYRLFLFIYKLNRRRTTLDRTLAPWIR